MNRPQRQRNATGPGGWLRGGRARSRRRATCVAVVLAAGVAALPNCGLSASSPAPRVTFVNGSFESKLTGWVRGGTVAVSTVAHGGRRAARVGGTSGHPDNSALSKTFVVPDGAGALRLWYRVSCHGSLTHNWAKVTLTDLATHETNTLLGKSCRNAAKWERISANLGGHAGHRVRLRLTSHDDEADGPPTYVLFDDVAIVHADFSLSHTRTARVAPGASAKIKVTTVRTVGTARSIKLSATKLPAGVTASWRPATLNAGESSVLTLTALPSAGVTTVTISLVGRTSSAVHVARLALSVKSSVPHPAACSGVAVTPSTNLSTLFESFGGGTTFCFAPGVYVLKTHLFPRSNDKVISTTPRGAILTGQDKYNGGFMGYGGPTGNHDVLVQGFVFHHFTAGWPTFPRSPIQTGDRWTVRNNEISYNSQSGASINTGVDLVGNWIHHNGRYGFTGGPGSNMLIENNEISYNNTKHYNTHDDAGGSKIVKSTKVVLRGNNVHDNYGNGLWCDWANLDVTYSGNTLSNNYLAGIFHEASARSVIRDNTFTGNGIYAKGKSLWFAADIQLNDSKNTEIYGNKIVAGANGIALIDTERGSTVYGLLEIKNVSVHDNTITLPAGGFSGLVSSRVPFSFTNVHFEHNTYNGAGANDAAWEWPPSNKSWQQWQSLGNDVTGRIG